MSTLQQCPGSDTARENRSARQSRIRTQLLLTTWFSVLYFPLTVAIAAHKPFWNDELFTFYISALPFRQIWTALLTGVDQQPPAYYWLTHELLRASSSARLAVRLPEVLGFWVFGAGLIAIVSRYLPPAYGLVAALVAAVSGAYPYAYEGRPYAMLLGLAALALLCWQQLDGVRRQLWAGCLAATLAAAVSTHYYGVLLLYPFGAAELARAWTARAIRWRAWGAMAAGMAPLLAWLPLIRSSSAQKHDFWAKPDFNSIHQFLTIVLLPLAVPLCVIGMVAVSRRLVGSRRLSAAPDPLRLLALPLPELVALLGFVTLPVLAVAVATVATGAYTPRYALPAVTGFCVLAAWMLAAVFEARSRPAYLAAAFLSAFFVVQCAGGYQKTIRIADQGPVIWMLEHYASAQLPVAIASPHLFFELSYQAPRRLKDRFFYIAEPEAAKAFLGTGAVDRGVLGMQPWADLRVRTLAGTLSSGSPFLVFGYPGAWSWLVPELTSRHVPMSVAGALGPNLLFRATPAK